jgi:hypothetical protein
MTPGTSCLATIMLSLREVKTLGLNFYSAFGAQSFQTLPSSRYSLFQLGLPVAQIAVAHGDVGIDGFGLELIIRLNGFG